LNRILTEGHSEVSQNVNGNSKMKNKRHRTTQHNKIETLASSDCLRHGHTWKNTVEKVRLWEKAKTQRARKTWKASKTGKAHQVQTAVHLRS